jgi:hypothetical protein
MTRKTFATKLEKTCTSADIKQEPNNSQKIILDLNKVIGAKAEYHTELKVITKDPKKMFNYLCSQAGYDNDKLNELFQ